MIKTLRAVVTDKGQISSARLINITGFIIGSTIMLYHAIWLAKLDAEIFGIYMLYSAGVYGTGKFMDRKYRGSDDNNNERFEAHSNISDEYNVGGSVDR